MEDETYCCAGCGGQVSVVEAVWLPEEPRKPNRLADSAMPYCCSECFTTNCNPSKQARIAREMESE